MSIEHILTVEELPKHQEAIKGYPNQFNGISMNEHCKEGTLKEYKPFEPKPKELKADYLLRKQKWEESQKETSNKDIDHRRFNTTLTVNQMVTGFKRCVHRNEVDKENLMTCYRVVLQKLLQDPNLTDLEFIKLYELIQPKATTVYARRSRELKRIRT